jgi:hypothetical protein
MGRYLSQLFWIVMFREFAKAVGGGEQRMDVALRGNLDRLIVTGRGPDTHAGRHVVQEDAAADHLSDHRMKGHEHLVRHIAAVMLEEP